MYVDTIGSKFCYSNKDTANNLSTGNKKDKKLYTTK